VEPDLPRAQLAQVESSRTMSPVKPGSQRHSLMLTDCPRQGTAGTSGQARRPPTRKGTPAHASQNTDSQCGTRSTAAGGARGGSDSRAVRRRVRRAGLAAEVSAAGGVGPLRAGCALVRRELQMDWGGGAVSTDGAFSLEGFCIDRKRTAIM
jgi:hypothetical protein